MSHERTRLSLVEYGTSRNLSSTIVDAIGNDRARANQLLIDAGQRAAANLGMSYNPISIDSLGVRAIDFAGLIRLGPSLELEVSPKFLGLDDSDASWREDFFFLSTLSRHGELLAAERLEASGAGSRDLSTLVARSIVSMYEDLKRRPLRSYRRVKEVDFFIDGDPDPVDLIFPGSDGYEQELIKFDRRNSWNADIVAAACELLPEVSDPSVAGSLLRLIGDLAPQPRPGGRRKRIPARHSAWTPLHELSVDVLNGLGVTYQQGLACAPGYLVRTWQIWEDLITIASRLGFGSSAVAPQSGVDLGSRTKVIPSARVSQLKVYPDCVIEGNSYRPRMVLDAKYKGHSEKGHTRISEADIYESLAFSRATGCNQVVLAYPALPSSFVKPVGTCALFESIQVDSVLIRGVQVESRQISKIGALRAFALNFAQGISSLF